MLLKFYWLTFSMGINENWLFSRFLYPGEFWIFSHQICLIVKSYWGLDQKCKYNGYSGKQPQSCDFGRFWHFLSFLFKHKSSKVMLLKIRTMYVHSRKIKYFFASVSIEPKINIKQTKFSKSCEIRVLVWALKVPFSVLLLRKTWNLVSV